MGALKKRSRNPPGNRHTADGIAVGRAGLHGARKGRQAPPAAVIGSPALVDPAAAGGHQSEVPLGEDMLRIAGETPDERHRAGSERLSQDIEVVGAADLVGDHPGDVEIGVEGGAAGRDRGDGPGLAF